MKKYYSEILILSLLAIIIGVLTGAVDAFFGIILLKLSDFRTEYFVYLIPFLAPVGVFIAWSYQKYAGRAAKGMGLVFDVGFGNEDVIPSKLIPFSIISTWLTHLFGGSAGREGVAVQLGATISNNLGNLLGLKKYKQTLVIVGMAAGFGGLFQTPLAAAFFAIEVMIAGKLNYKILLPALIGAFTASSVSNFLGLEKFTFSLNNIPDYDYTQIFKVAFLGILFGLIGFLFSYLLAYAKVKLTKLFPNPLIKIAVGGVILSILMFIFFQGRYSGLGTNLISIALDEQKIYSFDFILKLLLTILTLSVGFQGGEVTPLFAIGASLGAIMAPILGLPVAFCAALGYASVFSSATNTFLAPVLIGCEVFGFNTLPFFIISIALSYTFNFNKSIYGAQKVI
ncbi:voltage-gated chloride channel protein [Floricoccus penangensis]|uniref:Voltage-gated chloride channel protein n=1 Tax=Floricoccus penangensis TaxID=1859475 RepID=A0A9Q5JID7_9LACT|nr:chloride channel protein [Floricoccus penangensis]OFI47913.1 voltage-gated chloride channel protein [Floricoccus penangensis]